MGEAGVTKTGVVSETEKMIQLRWVQAEGPAWLMSEAGERLRLLYPGTWNHGPGPDFRGARLVGESSGLLHGDVELHQRERDWAAHGHHRDPAYAGVVLHVLGAQRGRRDRVASLSSGRTGAGPIRVVLMPAGRREDCAVAPAERLPCHDVVRRAGRAAAAARLERLAVDRLRRKAARLSRAAEDALPDEVAYLALMGALGQADNRAAMERVAAEVALAELLGAQHEAITERLFAEGERLERESAIHWQRRGRPANRPEARLSAAAALLARMLPELAVGLAGLALLEPRDALSALRVPRVLGAGARSAAVGRRLLPARAGTARSRRAGRRARDGRAWSRAALAGLAWRSPSTHVGAVGALWGPLWGPLDYAGPWPRGATVPARLCWSWRRTTAAWAAAPSARWAAWHGSRWRVEPALAQISLVAKALALVLEIGRHRVPWGGGVS